ncbi:HEAT repeat domain-containing protein [Amycolatopsis sp. H6(2020)]|nr:HEAT repeat domain-containing protein [Amycolatopsis sp. H6(2020)]
MSRRLIVRDFVEGAAIRSLAEDAGWSLVGEIARDPDRGIFYEAKWDTGNGEFVHYVVDEFADAAYLVVANETSDATLSRIEAGLPVWSPAELLEDCYLHVYPAGWARSLRRLGAGAPLTVEEPVLAYIRFSAEHQDAPVRRAAVWAMTYTGWPEFAEVLATLAQDDDPRVAGEARQALEVLPVRPGTPAPPS